MLSICFWLYLRPVPQEIIQSMPCKPKSPCTGKTYTCELTTDCWKHMLFTLDKSHSPCWSENLIYAIHGSICQNSWWNKMLSIIMLNPKHNICISLSKAQRTPWKGKDIIKNSWWEEGYVTLSSEYDTAVVTYSSSDWLYKYRLVNSQSCMRGKVVTHGSPLLPGKSCVSSW